MNQIMMALVPGIKFMEREIYIQQHGVLDKDAQKHAVVLGRIMKEQLLSKRAGKSPIIRPGTIT
jgi:hypothetical protein